MKNRLADPSEICALDSKHEFRRPAICSVADTIGIDRPILGIFREDGVISSAQKRPSATTQHIHARRSSRADWLGAIISGWTQVDFKM